MISHEDTLRTLTLQTLMGPQGEDPEWAGSSYDPEGSQDENPEGQSENPERAKALRRN